MCEYCKQPYCFGACPTQDRPKRLIFGFLGICSTCGEKIYRGKPFQYKEYTFYCLGGALAAVKGVLLILKRFSTVYFLAARRAYSEKAEY